jgi:hypothetical protein
MDRYTKGFVVASLVYFFLASVLGTWMGATGGPYWARFAHVHFNLLGFMSMMIYGVGYFILPRFNGRTLRWPSWVPVHFYAANAGLLGMVATAPSLPSTGFALFSILSVLSAAMFVVNLGATILLPAPKEESEDEEEAAPSARAGAERLRDVSAPARAGADIHPDMRVGEILSRWPETVAVFVRSGFPSLGNPEHREQVKQLPVTLRMACQRHNVDLDTMVARLVETAGGAAAGAGVGTAPWTAARKGRLARGEPIRPDAILGDILAAYPETEKVFKKYYGEGCFSCPGQATESVRQSALMHNIKETQILADLNRAAGF